MSGAGKLARSDSDLLPFARCAGDYASILTDRWDLVVRAGRGLGRGAPACFIPATAEIELDADACMSADKPRLYKIGWSIGSIDLVKPKHRALVPVTAGALAHECGHSLFSLWPFDPAMKARIASEPGQVVQLATALEEGRQEARIASLQPSIIPDLRRTLTALIIPSLASVPEDDPYAILQACALIMPRACGWEGGTSILPMTRLHSLVDSVLGTSAWDAMTRSLVREFSWENADSDDTVLRTARQWWDLLPESAKDDTASGGEGASCPAHGDSGEGEGKPDSGDGSDALREVKDACEESEIRSGARKDKEAVREARETDKTVGGAEAADKRKRGEGLTGRGSRLGASGVNGRRDPSPIEVATAKKLGAILRSAQTVAKVRTPKTVPPGRLRGRAAVSWSRDRAMGKASDAALFRGKVRGETVPPLRVGIGMDVSGSMGEVCGLAAGIGWTLAASARDAEALVSGVCFGGELYPYVEVGRAHSDVRTLGACDSTEMIGKAVTYLDDALDLMSGDGVRILILISDGVYIDPVEGAKAGKWVTDFCRTGGIVIYVGRRPGRSDRFMGGWPMPPASNVLDAPAELGALSAVVGQAIRRAYARI